MDFKKDNYIILEVIPNKSKDGDIIELTALKLSGLVLVDRFNYRLNKDKVYIKEFLDMCNYDNDLFIYKDNNKEILDELKKFVSDLKIILIDDTYTLNYLKDFNNDMETIYKYVNVKNIEEMVNKYKLEPSNYMVDLVFEAIINSLNAKN